MPYLVKRNENVCRFLLSSRNHSQILILVQVVQLKLFTVLIDLSLENKRHSENFLVKHAIPGKTTGNTSFAFLSDLIFNRKTLVPYLVVNNVLAVVDIYVFGLVHDLVLTSVLFLFINDNKHASQRLLNICFTFNFNIFGLIHYLCE
jgi:hypothetical protein